ncbi:MAG: hypothetical protein DMF63_08010 [Acidobacteria bacterium]|nr:MAG: hypothetical protein DMF63_08010 [Acidobacteriota bacterium]
MNEILLVRDLRAEQEVTSARRAFWSAAIFPCFVGSAFFFVSGLGVSALTGFGLMSASRFLAYSSVGLLFFAFILMFLGAHCMDRRDAAEKEERIENSRRKGLV